MVPIFTYYRRLLFLLLTILLGNAASAQLAGYASFQAMTIANSSTSLVVGYQMPIIINTQALISTSQMLSSGADIRFHSSCGGGTIYPHYIDTGLNTTATRIWVKIDSLSASSSKVIYMSYNNPSATQTSTLTIFNGPYSSTNQITGGTVNALVAQSQRGFRFSPNTDILVTQFGKYEPTGTTRTVTLFDFSSTNIVRQGTVTGSASVYTYSNITNPVWLTSGTQYVLELYQGSGDGYYYQTSSQVNSNLTYYDMRYCNSCSSTTFPTNVLSTLHYGYPDFYFYTRNMVTPAPTVTLGGSGGSAAAVSISSVPSNPICNGGPVVFTATPTNGGSAPTYTWYKNSTVVGTGSTYTLTGPVNGDQIYVTMVSNSPCATTVNATSTTITLAVSSAPAQPGTITGNTTPCATTTQTYSIAAVTNATSYAWTVPTGWTIVSGQGTTTLTATASATSGNITVTASNTTCGNSPVRTQAVTVGTIPATPGTITGNTYVCGTGGQSYSIATVSGATTYNWGVPTGWIILSGAGTNTITVSPSGTSGNINVTAGNACGTSLASSLAVNSGTAPPAPGPVTGNTSVCAGTGNTYSVPSTPGLTYNWTVPSGWTFTQSGSSISSIAGSSGNVTVTASNGTCATSAPTNYAVTVNPYLNPAVTTSNTSTGNSICSGTIVTFTANGTGGGTSPSYQWKLNGVNVGSNITTYTNNSLQNGDVITVTMTANGPCLLATNATSAPVTMTVTPTVTPGININTIPPTTSCVGTSFTFNTTITGGGSAPTYQWYKNTLPLGVTSPNYITSTLIDGDSLSVKLTSSSTCATIQSVMSNTVGVHLLPNIVPAISITASPSTSVPMGTQVTFTATINNGGPTPDIRWKINGLQVPYTSGNTFTTTTLIPGDIVTASLTSYAPCATPTFVVSTPLQMTPATGIDPMGGSGWDGKLSLYPNPNSGHFTIVCDWGMQHRGERVKIELVNTLGQQVYKNQFVPNTTEWTVPVWLGDEVANGIYQLRLRTESMSTVRGVSIQR